MSNPFSLVGETALITGGGTGLGLGIAQAMAGAGARVVIVGRREAVLREACDHLGAAARADADGDQHRPVAVPWTDRRQLRPVRVDASCRGRRHCGAGGRRVAGAPAAARHLE